MSIDTSQHERQLSKHTRVNSHYYSHYYSRSFYADVEKTVDLGKLWKSIQTRLDSWIFLVENFQTNDAAKGNDL